jgi:hypothetical protein
MASLAGTLTAVVGGVVVLAALTAQTTPRV